MNLIRLPALFILVVFLVISIIMIELAKKGRVSKIRRLSAVDAIEEIVGRATEMGRPVHFSPHAGAGTSQSAAAPIMAGISIASYVAKLCSTLGAKLIATATEPIVYTMLDAVIQETYLMEGAEEMYLPDTVRFIGGTREAYVAGVQGLFQREKIAGNICIGYFAMETLMLGEAAQIVGAMSVGGTTNIVQLAFFVAAYDYFLIADEIYAASAYITKDPIQSSTLEGQDMQKMMLIILTIVGSIFSTLGVPIMIKLLGG